MQELWHPRLLATVAAAALILAPAAARALSDADRPAIEGIIRDYLMKNPELLRDVMKELEKRQEAAEEKKRVEAIKTHSAVLNESPRGVVIGNPRGDVTLVEFFDYNCGYCRRAITDMLELVKNDPKLKIVLKEFPVLGPSSVEAARVAIAVRMQDKGGAKYLDFHRKLFAARGEVTRDRALAAAREAGLDMTRLERDLQSPEINATLEESATLADALALSGTPSYVIANEVVPGAVGYAALKAKVDAVRQCGMATC
jgi:protein-disulfide isomerase